MWCVLFMIFSQHQTWTCIYVVKHLLKQRLDIEIEVFHIKKIAIFLKGNRKNLVLSGGNSCDYGSQFEAQLHKLMRM